MLINDGRTQSIKLCALEGGSELATSGVTESIISTKTQDWRDEEQMCWLTNEPNEKASPSLRNCHSTTDNACCNWMHDDAIGSHFQGFVPAPCQGDYSELQLFMCLACRGGAQKYVIKAEATKEYIDNVTFLKREQKSSTDIHSSLEEDILAARATNGYVKVCASWVRRFWLPDYDPENTNF